MKNVFVIIILLASFIGIGIFGITAMGNNTDMMYGLDWDNGHHGIMSGDHHHGEGYEHHEECEEYMDEYCEYEDSEDCEAYSNECEEHDEKYCEHHDETNNNIKKRIGKLQVSDNYSVNE